MNKKYRGFVFFFCAQARGIVAEPDTTARRAEVADGADSPTRASGAPEVRASEAARPTNFASQNSIKN
jgi:hypothetical protein